jgi:hypothetical protein
VVERRWVLILVEPGFPMINNGRKLIRQEFVEIYAVDQAWNRQMQCNKRMACFGVQADYGKRLVNAVKVVFEHPCVSFLVGTSAGSAQIDKYSANIRDFEIFKPDIGVSEVEGVAFKNFVNIVKIGVSAKFVHNLLVLSSGHWDPFQCGSEGDV